MAASNRVGVHINIQDSFPLLRADQVRVKQILLNLMSNAVKFTEQGGNVIVAATFNPDGVVISVADNGIGMNPGDIEIALQPFRQIDGTLTRRFEGTGLGLPLAKALVELHSGILEIESAPARGTTVRIRRPRERVVSADSIGRAPVQEVVA